LTQREISLKNKEKLWTKNNIQARDYRKSTADETDYFGTLSNLLFVVFYFLYLHENFKIQVQHINVDL
jgi:hypothetical protein